MMEICDTIDIPLLIAFTELQEACCGVKPKINVRFAIENLIKDMLTLQYCTRTLGFLFLTRFTLSLIMSKTTFRRVGGVLDM